MPKGRNTEKPAGKAERKAAVKTAPVKKTAATGKPETGKIQLAKKGIKIAQKGSKAFNFTKQTIVPVALIVFAAAAYWLYDIPIPETKKKKVSKKVREALKDPESQKIYL